jgi:transposase
MNASAGVTNEAEAGGRPRRRKHSIVEKRRTVEATLVVGASVARVAREHGVNANQVWSWRRLYQRGLLGGNVPSVALVPVKVTDSAAAPVPPDPAVVATPTGSIQLRLPKGQLRVDGAVDAALLRVLVECLLR